MTAQIDTNLLKQILDLSVRQNKVIQQLLENLEQEDQFVSTKRAYDLTGIDPSRIRYLYRTGCIDGRKVSERKIEVSMKDLDKYRSKEAVNQ